MFKTLKSQANLAWGAPAAWDTCDASPPEPSSFVYKIG